MSARRGLAMPGYMRLPLAAQPTEKDVAWARETLSDWETNPAKYFTGHEHMVFMLEMTLRLTLQSMAREMGEDALRVRRALALCQVRDEQIRAYAAGDPS